MIRVGFIGTGGMGTAQAEQFAQVSGCEVYAGSDVAEPSWAKFAVKFPSAKLFDSHKKLLRDKSVDAVVIAVPTGHHKKVATDCLKAGRPVLCEKPLAMNVTDCKRLIDTADKTATLLMVAHCRRYDPHWKTWAKAVTDGKLGGPVLWRHLSAGIPQIAPWFMDAEMGGGPLLDGAIHNYDFANFMWGDPESVVSSAIKFDPSVTAIDTGSAVVRYKNGNQLMMSWSWRSRGLGLFDILGPKGFITTGLGGLPKPADAKSEYPFFCFTDSAGKQELLQAPTDDFWDMYRNQARHFLDCIEGKATCQTPATEAIKAVAVAEAILKAGPSGGARAVKW